MVSSMWVGLGVGGGGTVGMAVGVEVGFADGDGVGDGVGDSDLRLSACTSLRQEAKMLHLVLDWNRQALLASHMAASGKVIQEYFTFVGAIFKMPWHFCSKALVIEDPSDPDS